MERTKKLEKMTIILFFIAVIFTVLVKCVDVQSIGPKGSAVGFATINRFVYQLTGENDTWYNITKYLGIIPFLYVLFYAVVGLKQLIIAKKISKVDKKIIALGCFYVVLGLIYILFDKLAINYRPVLEDGVLEPSYPSSHTLLAVCVCLSSIFMNKYYIKNNDLKKYLNLGTLILMILLVLGRLLSGVHWASDIIGGVIISLFLVFGFFTTCKKIR